MPDSPHSPRRALRFPPYPLAEAFASPRLALRTAKRTALALWHGTQGNRRALPWAARRALHLVGRELYKPDEILQLGLLRAAAGDEDLRRVASRSTMVRIASELNPAAWRGCLENKATFSRLAAAAGLPVPRMLGVLLPKRVSWWCGEPVAASPRDWEERLRRDCPAHFVIKPAVGGWGRNVAVIERRGADRFVAADGRERSAEGLLAELVPGCGDDGCIVQERVWNHPTLEAFSGSRHLQTLRIYSLLGASGEAHVLRASFRAIAGANWVDNYGDGRAGNFIAQIDPERGVLASASAADRERGGLRDVERHPDTGVAVAGFALPDWAEALELVRALARSFAPLRWAGWDVALTPEGPVAIEGNWNADAPNNSRRVDALFAEIARLA